MDTKSSGDHNLLHYLERVVTDHFPHVEGFLQELEKPAQASKVNYKDLRNEAKTAMEEVRSIRRSLEANFQDASDGYTRKMFRFSAMAEDQLREIRDGVLQVDAELQAVETYYGEGEEMGRPLGCEEFFGIFATFTSSWKVGDPTLRLFPTIY